MAIPTGRRKESVRPGWLAAAESRIAARTVATEKRVAAIRIATVSMIAACFPLLTRSHGWHRILLGCVIGVTWVYALLIYAIKPYRRGGILGSSYFTPTVDALVILSLIFLTGGFYSPFHVAIYLSVIAVSFRFRPTQTVVIAALYTVGYFAVITVLNQFSGNAGDLLIRFAFMVSAALLGAMMSNQGLSQVRATVKLEEQVRTWEQMENQRVLHESILQAQSDLGIGIAITDKHRMVFANEGLARLYGYTHEELLNVPSYWDLVAPEERKDLSERIRRRFAGGPLPDRGEATLIRKDGTPLRVEYAARLIRLGDEWRTLSIVHDVTERRQLQARLAQADRIISMGMLASGVAHEINNPMTYVSANLEFVSGQLGQLGNAASVESWNELNQAIKAAEHGAERVRRLVQDLKAFSRVDDGATEPLDVRNSLQSAINIAWNEIRHRATLVKELGEVPLVDGNESRLGQVFLNLLINAAQSIPVGQVAENKIHVLTGTDSWGRVLITVRDTGPGIDQEIRDRIFDPFFTTKPPGVGTGLGLSICQGIVSAMGGEIEVESEAGKGSTFRVLLPAATRGVAAKKPFAPIRAGNRKGRVLLIDDEPLICAALARLLSRDHQVLALPSARKALERIRAGEQFDAIVCDLMMPQMTGMAFYQELRREAPQLAQRTIFMTGEAFTQPAREFLERMGRPQIGKPVEIEPLRALIDELLVTDQPLPAPGSDPETKKSARP